MRGELGRLQCRPDLLGDARELLGLVTHALEIGDRLDDRHDGAQIPSRGRVAGDQMDRELVDGNLELIDLVILFHRHAATLGIAVEQVGECVAEMLLGHSTHVHEERPQRVQIFVVTRQGVRSQVGRVLFAHFLGFSCGRLVSTQLLGFTRNPG